MLDVRASVIAVSYIVAAILFIFGLKQLSSPSTARAGNRLAAIGMLLALVATLIDRQIVSYWTIAIGTLVGAVIGIYFARTVQMTAMPQMVALFNGMGGATASLVSVAEFIRLTRLGEPVGAGEATSIVLGCAIGAISFTGSIVAFGKLQEILPGKPLQFPLQRFINALILLAVFVLGVIVVMGGGPPELWMLFAAALVLGAMFVLPIGGGDMPVVISILNSLTGLAAALTGFVLHNQMLVVAGVLVGASGTLLTLLMSTAMNRSVANVLFGAFGASTSSSGAAAEAVARTVRQTTPEDTAIALAYARSVVIVPGYGLAVAEAQHTVRELATDLEKRGVDVKYAIHPVAGRMPGHMNVLLAEANVPYDQLLEMDQVNGEFPQTDVVLVVGANDVVNPAARDDPSSPIYGMPILDVDRARNIIVLKRSMGHGFAGIDNALFYHDKTRMLFGDARQSLTQVGQALKSA
ncbi:MAG TPA: NAD(P)(+) transhydrogenase (Re/Si-specific) subunit beta [Gemmatimonadaceae bacterium]|jgi:NAD(P) transhydrogenase subunit beta|nr:NAD(P)(+) transhydrogenase (Re/Si-specific) subunit beta [Gemmatimonadaceae bacterium]